MKICRKKLHEYEGKRCRDCVKIYNQTPEIRDAKKIKNQKPEYKYAQKIYRETPERKNAQKIYRETNKASQKIKRQTPEAKAAQKIKDQRPEAKIAQKIRNQKPERKAARKIYRETLEAKTAQKNRSNNRYASDINYRISTLLRSRLRLSIKRNQKKGSAVRDLGCSVEFLKNYFESLFEPWMNWDNHGNYDENKRTWQIDHIVSLASFNLSNREEFLIACNYKNLQPLGAFDNLSKGNR